MAKFFYRVDKDETLISVCNKFNLPPLKIIKLNNLKKEIEQGDLLYVESFPDNAILYKVQPLDTVEKIARKFGVDKNELLQKNGVPYIFYGLVLEI